MAEEEHSSSAHPEKLSVALIGSSGGGTATLGHTKPIDFIRIIENELGKIDDSVVVLSEAIFVALDGGKGMDGASASDSATLFHVYAGNQVISHGTLAEINNNVEGLQEKLAKRIEDEQVNGLICVSCKSSLFRETLTLAAKKDVPVTGTGGTSLSMLSSEYDIELVGNAGGSVATTPLTKAISFSHALAQSWGLSYRPWLKKGQIEGTFPSWRSVLNSTLPAFWAVALCKRAVQQLGTTFDLGEMTLFLEVLESYSLPMCCAVVMANSRSASPSVLMGSIIAASACRETILGGLLAGWLTTVVEEQFLYLCILRWNIPATMTNLLTTGFVGAICALVLKPISFYLATLSETVRLLVATLFTTQTDTSLESARLLTASLLGSTFCYGSKVGWYHSFLLPLILIEMEKGDPAFLGAMDQLTLVLVCAGICLAVWVSSLTFECGVSDVSLIRRGLLINLTCGDFIEACYPLMEENPILKFGGYLASACSVALLSSECKSSAYLPFPVSIWFAEDWKHFAFTCAISFGLSFGLTVVGLLLSPKKR